MSRSLVTHGPEAILVGADRRPTDFQESSSAHRTPHRWRRSAGPLAGQTASRPECPRPQETTTLAGALAIVSVVLARRINSPESSPKRSRSNSFVHYWERLTRALHCRTRSDQSLTLREGRAPTEGESEGSTHHTLTNVLPSHSGLVRIVPPLGTFDACLSLPHALRRVPPSKRRAGTDGR